ncbi:MAG TPA: thiamine pyrophosphate-dependent enzyme [Pseudolabrys sp.]|nr:thiamine pyrophosphate-dependent enzyme [Pseudolabrys sp.]
MSLERRAAMAALLKDRDDSLLVVPGLGSTTWDLAAAGDDPRNFYMWGAMGGAAMIGLGLALAQPARRVAVITGDGEMLMGLGSLATIGIQKPPNLAVIVFDNGVYGETGMQPSHTQGGVDLMNVAKACGIASCLDVRDEESLDGLGQRLKTLRDTLFARVAINPEDPPRVLPERDGVAIKERFRAAIGVRA